MLPSVYPPFASAGPADPSLRSFGEGANALAGRTRAETRGSLSPEESLHAGEGRRRF